MKNDLFIMSIFNVVKFSTATTLLLTVRFYKMRNLNNHIKLYFLWFFNYLYFLKIKPSNGIKIVTFSNLLYCGKIYF